MNPAWLLDGLITDISRSGNSSSGNHALQLEHHFLECFKNVDVYIIIILFNLFFVLFYNTFHEMASSNLINASKSHPRMKTRREGDVVVRELIMLLGRLFHK